MKHIILLVGLVFTLTTTSQNKLKPIPESWTLKSTGTITPITLKKPDLSKLKAEDVINDKDKSIPWRFGYDHFVNYGLNNSGKWHELDNGNRIWRVNFISPTALTINLIFDTFNIPKGSKVYIYNNDKSEILNVFTHEHNNPEGILGTWMVKGDHIWVEYFEPKKVKGLGKLNISNIIHGYRTLENKLIPSKALNDSGPCNVDVNCDISGFNATAHEVKENVKKSVAMVVVGGGTGICSGALVNNTNNDGTPYFLTANHCLGGSVAGWAYRFNWASDEAVADCATNAPSVDNGFIQTASGGILRASNSESDMALIEITDNAFFNSDPDVVWAGWNRSKTDIPNLTVGIHHPSGDIQKVCVDTDNALREVINFNGNPTTEVWRVSDWDLGVTEPGSSGSPLFNQDGLIIGKLSGGFAACIGTNDNNLEDWYGRFGVSWDFSSTNSEQLKFWLDPAGTNPEILNQFPALEVFDNDVAIGIRRLPITVCDNEITPSLRITNKGANNLTSVTIAYQLNSEIPTTINWTGNLTTDASESIPLPAIPVSANGTNSFTATVSNPNGVADENITNNEAVTNFEIPQTYSTQTLKVIITPDRYGAETTWNIKDENGITIANGGPYTTIATNGTQPDEITDINLNTDGCYTFTINDSANDGLCCLYGSGTYRIEDGSGNILINGNGQFGSISQDIIKINNTLNTSENAIDESISIYPNPFLSSFSIRNRANTNLSYSISNLLGQEIKTGSLNFGANTINLLNQNAGFYFITIIDQNSKGRITKKIIKQ